MDLDGWPVLLGAGKIVLSQYTSPIPSHRLSQHFPGGSQYDVRVLQVFASLGTPGLWSCCHATCSRPLPPSPLTESLLQGPVFALPFSVGPVFALPFSVFPLWPCDSLVVQFRAHTPAALEPSRYTHSPLPGLQRVLVLSPSLLIHGSPLSIPRIPFPARLCQLRRVLAMDTDERAEGNADTPVPPASG